MSSIAEDGSAIATNQLVSEEIVFDARTPTFAALSCSYQLNGYLFVKRFDGDTGRAARTVQHAFEAHKYIWEGAPLINQAYVDFILDMPMPKRAHDLGVRSSRMRSWDCVVAAFQRQLGGTPLVNPQWNHVQVDVMRSLLQLKFQVCPMSVYVLSQTGKRVLRNNSDPLDYFWGIGPNGTGDNWVGRILMEIRDTLPQFLQPCKNITRLKEFRSATASTMNRAKRPLQDVAPDADKSFCQQQHEHEIESDKQEEEEEESARESSDKKPPVEPEQLSVAAAPSSWISKLMEIKRRKMEEMSRLERVSSDSEHSDEV
jgi:predicted NAD-dependent protein-ADP-ribosyltransferase YbiA (DUF1768 family)